MRIHSTPPKSNTGDLHQGKTNAGESKLGGEDVEQIDLSDRSQITPSEIKKTLANTPNLRSLVLSDETLPELKFPEIFEKLPNLTTLKLTGTMRLGWYLVILLAQDYTRPQTTRTLDLSSYDWIAPNILTRLKSFEFNLNIITKK